MKKALVLGAMAFFAINLITVQNINAQDKGISNPAKASVSAKPSTAKTDVKPTTNVKKANSNLTVGQSEGTAAAKQNVGSQPGNTTVKKANNSLTVGKSEGAAAAKQNTMSQDEKAVKMQETQDIKKANGHLTTTQKEGAKADKQQAKSQNGNNGASFKVQPKVKNTTLKNDQNLKLKPKEIKSEKTDAKANTSKTKTNR